MIKGVLPGIYQIEIPLPGNPLKALNSYFIRGPKRSLLIDTGFNWPACRETMQTAIQKLGANWSEIDIFLSHMHGDHSGLINDLATDETIVYCSSIDAEYLRKTISSYEYWRAIEEAYTKHGLPITKPMVPENMKKYLSGCDVNFKYVSDNDFIEVGDYQFVPILTPGHTPGHVCLYEPNHKILFSGDHILATITSNITFWIGMEDSLGQYLDSLDKIMPLEIALVLPAHRQSFTEVKERIVEIKLHHEKRLNEIAAKLYKNPMSAYEIASIIKWNVKTPWDQFSWSQKWFSVGETIAHLEYLEKRNILVKSTEGNQILYSLA